MTSRERNILMMLGLVLLVGVAYGVGRRAFPELWPGFCRRAAGPSCRSFRSRLLQDCVLRCWSERGDWRLRLRAIELLNIFDLMRSVYVLGLWTVNNHRLRKARYG